MRLNRPEDIIAITPSNPFSRFPDGRPRVPDEVLERVKSVTLEEAWHVLNEHGYVCQSDGTFLNLHPERAMVGRAVTATMVPLRPDLNDVVKAVGVAAGWSGPQNAWVIDTVVEGDVVVVDVFGKVKYGTFVGDNLASSVQSHGGAGLVLDCGIRDTQQIFELPEINVLCRGSDGTHLREVTLASLNAPAHVGYATVLPGDVVLATRAGVIFIPPHLVMEVVEHSEDVRKRDRFAQQRMRERKYTSGQIDVRVWASQIEADYQKWKVSQKS